MYTIVVIKEIGNIGIKNRFIGFRRGTGSTGRSNVYGGSDKKFGQNDFHWLAENKKRKRNVTEAMGALSRFCLPPGPETKQSFVSIIFWSKICNFTGQADVAVCDFFQRAKDILGETSAFNSSHINFAKLAVWVSRRDVDANLKFNCNESGSSIADLTNSLMSDVLGGDSAATKSVGEFVFRWWPISCNSLVALSQDDAAVASGLAAIAEGISDMDDPEFSSVAESIFHCEEDNEAKLYYSVLENTSILKITSGRKCDGFKPNAE
ncbi:unnamed protein product [Enterobius vermicularis]|uniref:SERPIN domain-containing protein n=1 Tax=Enterobius vermicularis TaxID=51028 RepID=A0A0N4UWF1_ENTVE|nr:unnamed protein product [Enterobius vermicularis]